MGYGATSRILRTLEEDRGHKEPAVLDQVTVEHVMPQTLSEEWIATLGENYEEKQQRYLHTLGNLTLSAYNQELYNKPFAQKKEEYARSHLELNRYLSNFEKWDETEIQQRAQTLGEQALLMWPRLAEA